MYDSLLKTTWRHFSLGHGTIVVNKQMPKYKYWIPGLSILLIVISCTLITGKKETVTNLQTGAQIDKIKVLDFTIYSKSRPPVPWIHKIANSNNEWGLEYSRRFLTGALGQGNYSGLRFFYERLGDYFDLNTVDQSDQAEAYDKIQRYILENQDANLSVHLEENCLVLQESVSGEAIFKITVK